MTVTKTNLNRHLDWFFRESPQKIENVTSPIKTLDFVKVKESSSDIVVKDSIPHKSKNVFDDFDDGYAIDLTEEHQSSSLNNLKWKDVEEPNILKPIKKIAVPASESEEDFDDVDEEMLRAAEMEVFQSCQPLAVNTADTTVSHSTSSSNVPRSLNKIHDPSRFIEDNDVENRIHVSSVSKVASISNTSKPNPIVSENPISATSVSIEIPIKPKELSNNLPFPRLNNNNTNNNNDNNAIEKRDSASPTPSSVSSQISIDFSTWPHQNLLQYLDILRDEKSEISDRIIEVMERYPFSSRFKEWIPKRDILSQKISSVLEVLSNNNNSNNNNGNNGTVPNAKTFFTPPSSITQQVPFPSTIIPESTVKENSTRPYVNSHLVANDKITATPFHSEAVVSPLQSNIRNSDIAEFDEFDIDDADFTFNTTDPINDESGASSDVVVIDDEEDDIENRPLNQALKASKAAVSNASLLQSSSLDRPLLGEMKDKNHKVLMPSLDDPMLSYPWSKEVLGCLKHKFHLKGFRKNQLEAINGTLSGKDVFILMPTGGGKSLCYQLPAVIEGGASRGVTLVISPLLSLMQDQLDHLRKLNIPSLPLSGEQPADERRQVISFLMAKNVLVKLLYVTPEGLASNGAITRVLKSLYERKLLARIVIDEAHCVSHWGHDFRPDYKQLGLLRDRYQGIPFMALTATANEIVKKDIINTLRMENCLELKSSFNRPNLFYEIKPKKDLYTELYRFISNGHLHESGIIYCLSRTSCEQVAAKLRNDYGLKAWHYHAGLEKAERQRIQNEWQSGSYKIIVATIAFGMGVDKGDVRFVIHHSFPKSLEGYYQETGRAGRDGKPAHCIMFYSYKDHVTFQKLIMSGDGDAETKERQRQMLRQVIQFCENKTDCRRKQVLAYFGENFDKVHCRKGCDICCEEATYIKQDMTEFSLQAIKLLKSISGKATLLQLMDIFRGSKSAKIVENGWDRLEGAGVGKLLNRGDSERLFHHLVSEGVFVEKVEANRRGFVSAYVVPGRQTIINSVLAGKRRIILDVKESSSKPDTSSRSLSRSKTLPALREYQLKSTTASVDCSIGTREVDEIYDSQMPPVKPSLIHSRNKIDLEELSGQKFMSEYEIDVMARCLKDLKLLRSNLMAIDDSRVSSYFTDSVLLSMAKKLPRNVKELKEIHGVSNEKAVNLGPKFLQVIQKFIDEKEQNLEGTELDPSLQSLDTDYPIDTNALSLDHEQGFSDDSDSVYEPSSPIEEGDEEVDGQRKDILNFMNSQSLTQTGSVPKRKSTSYTRPSKSYRHKRGSTSYSRKRKYSTSQKDSRKTSKSANTSFIHPMVKQNYR